MSIFHEFYIPLIVDIYLVFSRSCCTTLAPSIFHSFLYNPLLYKIVITTEIRPLSVQQLRKYQRLYNWNIADCRASTHGGVGFACAQYVGARVTRNTNICYNSGRPMFNSRRHERCVLELTLVGGILYLVSGKVVSVIACIRPVCPA